jgi:hypothetical protein
MSYKLNEQRITPGGLDLLVPSDQNPRRAALTDLVNVPQGECLDLTDWFAGCDGRLEQALQPVAKSNFLLGAQNSLLEVSSASGNRIYYSDGSVLRQIGRGVADAPLEYDGVPAAFDGFPLGMISYQGFAWIMNTAGQYRDDGTTLLPWTIAATLNAPVLVDLGSSGTPGVNGGAGAKSYPNEDCYFVTWVTPLLGESNPTPCNRLTPAVGETAVSFQITQPVGAPSCATGWNIYRQVPSYNAGAGNSDGNATPYLLNPSPIPVGAGGALATYVDTGNPMDAQDDTSLLLLGVIMQEGMDPPPAARIIASDTYNGRIVVANSIQYPNRMWFTNPLQPAFFPGSSDTYDGNWVDVGTDAGDAILAITVRPGFLTIYRSKSIWVHLGDCGSDSAILQPAVPECGVVGPRAVVSTSASDYFIWVDGVYSFNNDVATKLSIKVDPIWRGLTTENFPPLAPAYMSQCAIGHRNGRLYCSYPTAAGVMAVSLVLHLPTGRWFSCSTGWLCFLDTGTSFLGANAGVYTLESAYNSAGDPALAFQSQYHDSGLPDRMKTWADLVLTHNTQGMEMSVVCRQNKDGGVWPAAPPAADSFTLATFASTALTKQIFPLVYPSTYTVAALRGLPIKNFNLSIRIVGGAGGGTLPAIIESPILLHYYVEARQGLTFDSGPTNHGLEGAGRIDQVEIDCDTSNGTAALTISSDIPGGVLGDGVAAHTIPQSTGRQVLRWVLTAPLAGRLFRHQIASAEGFQIYGYKVRVLPLGVYVDGSQSDFWYTLPLAPGAGGQ